MTEFIHLRVKSSYSLLQSALKIEQITERCKKLNMPAVALTDHDNLFAMLEFSMAASKAGIQPIHGTIVTIEDQGEYGEILLLAKNQTGYHNLLKLVSHIYTTPDIKNNHHILFSTLGKYQEGLILLSGYTKGLIGKALLDNKEGQAKFYIERFYEIFGDRFYLEIMRHKLATEQKIEQQYIELASKYQIPLVATNNILFEDIKMHEAHDVLLCIAAGLTKEHSERKMVSNQCYFKSPKEMCELFHDLPEALENSINIAKRCSVIAESCDPMLPNFTNSGINEKEALRKEAIDGLEEKLAAKFKASSASPEEEATIRKAYVDRINYELKIICDMNFAGYFLIVSDFIKWSKVNNISVGPGRGSGAGSVVAWSLLITDPDPLRFGLIFERFLNPERISMPDFDIDFCQERRGEVIEYVRQKYGSERVAQIITFGKMQAKAVIKDVSRVLGLRYEFADYLTELVPFNAVNPVTLDQAIRDVAELRQASKGEGLYNLEGEEELIKQVLDTALTLEGIHRHVSVHAAGIVIAGKNLVELLPVYKDPSDDMLIVQYSMKYAEAAGLVKFDFLGLQTLTVIAKCTELLKSQGVDIDLPNLPLDDKTTYELLSRGEGAGVFQFESVGMRDTLRRMRPDCIEDLIALGALYRPGPMDNIPTYISCKHGKEKPDYLHPSLETILKETYGVIIYQEQVLAIAQILSGYSLGAADLLRRAMGKKIKAEMEAQEQLFVSGAEKNNVDSDQAKNIFATVAKFAGYGFNKAHATSYAMISYQTAYLKANYTTEFLVACLNLDMNDSDKINLFIQEAKLYNINVLAPDINRASGYFVAENGDIIFPLGAIKNVTPSLGAVVKEARGNLPFHNIFNFLERMPPKTINKRSLENMIKAGCFDKLHSNRNQLLLSATKLLSHYNLHHEEQKAKQISLIPMTQDHILVKAIDISSEAKAFMEFDVLGSFFSYHPIEAYKKILDQNKIHDADYIKNHMPQRSNHIKIAGIIQKKDARMSARGRFITLQLSDPSGNIELSIFSEDILRNYVHLLELKKMVVVSCEAFKDEGGVRITATSFESLEDIIKQTKHVLKLTPKNKGELERILSLLKQDDKQMEANSYIEISLDFEGNFNAKIKIPDLALQNDIIKSLEEFLK